MDINELNQTMPQILDGMARQVQEFLQRYQRDNPLMIGIHTGGVAVAHQLHQRIGFGSTLCELNIRYYRDDFSKIGLHPDVKRSKLPLTVGNRHIVLVDDVLYSGRTVRAAHNELFDFGRPASVMLVVLIERDGRELPIQADVKGCHLDLSVQQHVKLVNEAPLSFALRAVG